jgi:hypothetical protein
MTELATAADFFIAKFTADIAPKGESGYLADLVGSRIYEDVASGGTDFPCIVFAFHAGTDVVAEGGRERLLTNGIYLIRGIAPGYGYVQSGVDAVASRIDAVLQATNDGNVCFCERTGPFEQSYTIDGVTYYERGGFYRLRINGG